MKYIDADLLREEIEKKSHEEQGFRSEDSEYGYRSCARDLLAFIDSLQQEQPEADFKIEERKWVHDAVDNIFPEDGDFMSEVDFRKILEDTARHFYELGRNSK